MTLEDTTHDLRRAMERTADIIYDLRRSLELVALYAQSASEHMTKLSDAVANKFAQEELLSNFIEPPKVVDLMRALEASLEAARSLSASKKPTVNNGKA